MKNKIVFICFLMACILLCCIIKYILFIQKSDMPEDVPKEYSVLIFNDYKKMIDNLCSENVEEYLNKQVPVEWFNMAIDAVHGIDNPQKKSFGYSIKDINGDDVEELILLREDYFLLAVYTLNEDEPYLLDTFNFKHNGMVLNTGELYTITSAGWNYTYFEVKKLEKNNQLLTSVCKFGCDGDNGYFFEDSNKERSTINKLDFEKLVKKYPDLDNTKTKDYLMNLGIIFTPVY